MNKSRRVQTFAFFFYSFENKSITFRNLFFNPNLLNFLMALIVIGRIHRNSQHDISPFSTEGGNQMVFLYDLFIFRCHNFNEFSANTKSQTILLEQIYSKHVKLLKL